MKSKKYTKLLRIPIEQWEQIKEHLNKKSGKTDTKKLIDLIIGGILNDSNARVIRKSGFLLYEYGETELSKKLLFLAEKIEKKER